MATGPLKKMPTRIMEEEDVRGKKQNKNVAFGQLKFGQYEGTKAKLAVRTFFGNPDTEVFCVKFDHDDNYIASANSDGSIKVFNLQTSKLEQSLASYSGLSNTPATCLRWRPPIHNKTKQILVSVNSDGSIVHWHAPTGNQVHRIMEPKIKAMCLDYNLDGSKFATGANDFHVRIYDEETKGICLDFPPADWNLPGHSNRVFSVKFLAHDPQLLLSGGWDSNVHMWDLRVGKSVAQIFGPSLSGDGLDYKNGLILTGSYRNDNQLQLWDLGTRKLFKQITWNKGESQNSVYLYSTQFSKIDDKTLAAGSSGLNEFVVYDTQNEYSPCASVIQISEGIYSVDYANKSNKVAFGGGEGVVYVMTLTKPQ